MRHSFRIKYNGVPVGLVRGSWDDAVEDARRLGLCTRHGPRVIETSPNATIARVPVRSLLEVISNGNA